MINCCDAKPHFTKATVHSFIIIDQFFLSPDKKAAGLLMQKIEEVKKL